MVYFYLISNDPTRNSKLSTVGYRKEDFCPSDGTKGFFLIPLGHPDRLDLAK